MKFSSTLALSSVLALGTVALAQTVQSKPFKLVVYTQGSKNSTTLQACHIGAAIESLCVGYGQATFNLNTTQGSTAPLSNDGVPGLLTWLLPSQPQAYSESMGFDVDVATNVATATFGLANPVSVAFDKDNLMNVVSYYNDLVTPPTSGKPVAYYRWYVCQTNFNAYVYNNLAWVYGKNPPQNPSCKKATVKRVFL